MNPRRGLARSARPKKGSMKAQEVPTSRPATNSGRRGQKKRKASDPLPKKAPAKRAKIHTSNEDGKIDLDTDGDDGAGRSFTAPNPGLAQNENKNHKNAFELLMNTKVLFEPPHTNQELPAETSPVGSIVAKIPMSTLKKKSAPAKKQKALPEEDKRPPPRGQPLVHAKTRGEICDSLPYFRMHQGGMHTKDGILNGILLAEDVGDRSYIDDRLILSRLGGGMNAIADGTYRLGKDQKPDGPMAAAFKNNMERHVAIAVILGSKNVHSQARPIYPFSVMAHFKPAFIWCEKIEKKIVVRLRFEKFEKSLQGHESWWMPANAPLTSGSPQKAGFICFNQKCKTFWKLEGKAPQPEDISYNPAWLAEETPWPENIEPPYALRPEPLPNNVRQDPFYATSYAATRGIVCEWCGRCISRKKMDGWFCETENCGWSYLLPRMAFSIRIVNQACGARFDGHAIPFHKHALPITRLPEQILGPWRKETFEISKGNFLVQLHSNEAVNILPGGPNDMFSAMTDPRIEFERRPMKSAQVEGTLTNHFNTNFGMPYKFAADTPTKPFSEAPNVVIDALHRMSWAAKVAVQDEPLKTLNEVLVLGYFEKQKIGYHDDGEDSLGPTIITLSLGSPGTMSLRMKSKYYHGLFKTKKGAKPKPITREVVVVEGCPFYEIRKNLSDNWDTWSERKKTTIIKDLRKEFDEKVEGTAPDCLQTRLAHGDFIIMHGPDIQKYYEHEITNDGTIRYALTARHVIPEQVDDVQRHFGDYDAKPEDEYHGDLDANAKDKALKAERELETYELRARKAAERNAITASA